MSHFKKDEVEKTMKISCPNILDAGMAKEFTDQAKAWMLSAVEQYVLDFSGVTEISKEFYKSIIIFKSGLKRDNKVIYSVNLTSNLYKQIKTDGVELAFNPLKSMADVPAIGKTHASGASINIEFIKPFIAATQKTLEVQCKTKVKVHKAFIKTQQISGVAVASVLSLISDGFSGSVALSFSAPVFLKIYENMFEEKHEKIVPEIEDAAGELLNIIYGIAKIELNPKGFSFQKALPTVFAGEKINIRHIGSRPAVVIPFETDVGLFHLEIEFDQTLGGKSV